MEDQSVRSTTERLVELFGSKWQAALDHAGLLSRRRAREIGAGDTPNQSLLAVIELLERTPYADWPPRWYGLGKFAERCPTLDFFSGLLLNGRVHPAHAVIMWDLERVGDEFTHQNISVGMLPQQIRDLPRDHPIRHQWRIWMQQWNSFHGGATVADWMESPRATPEGVIASWIIRDRVDETELRRAERLLSERIYGFSMQRVQALVEQFREASEFDDSYE